jgi:ubiquinone/menaquinone biosynthesis C-methylase UbiE
MNLSMRILEDEEIVSGVEGTLYANRQDDRSLSYSMVAYDIVERFNPSAQDSILEVCCGAGNLAHFIYKHSGNKNIIATDGSKELIRAASKKYEQENIRFEVQDIHHHASPVLHSIVICMDSFHHFTDPVKSLRHLMKLVKNDGSLYIIDLTRDCPVDLVRRRQGSIKNYHEQKRFLKSINASFTYSEMEENLSLAGARDYQLIYPRRFSKENLAYHAEWIAKDSIKEHLYEETFLICIVNV